MKKASPQVLEVEMGDGWIARVGRTARDNDLLTFTEAFPQDWWLHAKGCPGSHVVLHHSEQDEPGKQILEAAARLALKYSKAKATGKGAVSLARISDLSKAKGSPAGQVQLRKSKTLRVYPS